MFYMQNQSNYNLNKCSGVKVHNFPLKCSEVEV